MALSDQEIQDRAGQLLDAGNSPDDVKRYIDAAKTEQGAKSMETAVAQSAPPPAPNAPSTLGKLAYTAFMANPLTAPVAAMVKNPSLAPLGTRVAAGFLGSEGGIPGAMINGAGEGAAQFMEQGKVYNPGAMAASSTLGAIPAASAGGAIRQVASNAARFGLGAGAATEASSLVNTGQAADPATVAKSMGIGAAIPLAASTVGKLIGVGRQFVPWLAEEAPTTTRETTRQANVATGYVMPPDQANDGSVTTALTRFADPKATRTRANILDQANTQVKAASAIGAPNPDQLSPEVFDQLRQPHLDVYQEVADSHPDAQKALDELQVAREKAVDLWRDAGTPGNSRLKPEARAADAEAAKKEGELYDFIKNDPDLVKRFENARKSLAQIHVVERATNAATGEVNALDILRQQKNGTKLTGELADIALFAKSNPWLAKPASMITSPTVQGGSPYKAIGGSIIGSAMGGPLGAGIGAAVPAAVSTAKDAARELMLSRFYQNSPFARPYVPAPDIQKNLGRFLTEQAVNQ